MRIHKIIMTAFYQVSLMLITNVTLADPQENSEIALIPEAALAMDGDRIAWAGALADLPAAFSGAEVFEYAARLVKKPSWARAARKKHRYRQCLVFCFPVRNWLARMPPMRWLWRYAMRIWCRMHFLLSDSLTTTS